MGDILFHLKFAVKVHTPFEKRRIRLISAYNVLTTRASENVELSRIESQSCAFNEQYLADLRPQYHVPSSAFAIGSGKSTARAFQRAKDESHTLP